MLRWMDGFDHYGTDAARLRDGVYAGANNVSLVDTNPRTGERCLRITGGNDCGVRRIFDADLVTAAVGYAMFLPSLPTDSKSVTLAQFRDNANEAQLTVCLSSTGQVIAKAGTMAGGSVIGTSAPCVYDSSYQHVEVKGVIGAAGGVEVRINGVTVLNVTGVDTQPDGTESTTAQVLVGGASTAITGFPPYMLVDDLYAWDTTGAANNDFLGDKKVYTRLPDADTPTADWVPATGLLQYPMLDNVPPLDSSEYIFAEEAATQTQVGLSELPGEIVAISGVQTYTRAFKTDAGDANLQVSVVSGVTVEPGLDRPLSQAPIWYTDVVENDPATGAPWLLADLNAAQVLIERTL